MADNTTLNAGSGGDTLRTDDIGGVKVPVSKIMLGGDGLDLGFVSGSNPFPTQIQSGSVSGLLVGGVALSNANPLPALTQSGSLVGLLAGGLAVSNANPVPVSQQGTVTVAAHSITSGSVTGLLLGGVAVSNANGIPITDAGGSLTVDGSVTHLSGSLTGLLVGGVALSTANPIPVGGTATLTLPGSSTTTALITYQNAEPAAAVLSGSTVVAVNHAFGDPTISGSANQIIAPQGAGKRIAVLSLEAMCLTATNIRFVSTGSAGTITNISNKMYLPANGGVVLPHNPHGWFKTVANEGLNIDLSAANAVGVTLTWTIFNN